MTVPSYLHAPPADLGWSPAGPTAQRNGGVIPFNFNKHRIHMSIGPWEIRNVVSNEQGLRGEASDAGQRLGRILIELAVHSIAAIAAVGSIELVHLTINWMTHTQGLIFFQGLPFECPARWLFDAADLGIVALIMYGGFTGMRDVYWRQAHGQ
jgi:hypothetical protein